MREPKYANLPSIEDLDHLNKQKVAKLLEDLDEISRKRVKLADEEDDLKLELEMLQTKTGREGFRFGRLIFCSEGVAGRKTLDKLLLLENGCPATVLNASYKQSAAYVRNVFKRLEDDDE